ncbi:MAG: MFS transporter [Spirochaetota bacterium]
MSSATTMPATSGISRLIALLAGAHFAHHVLTALLVPLLPFIRDEFGLSYAQSGIVNSAFTLSYGLSQLPAGWMADRVGPRYMLLVGISGVAVAGAFIGLSPVFALLLAGLVLMGVAGGGYHPAASAVISKVVSPERRGRARGIHIIGGSSSHFLAPLIAAGLVALVGWRGSFLSLSVPVGVLGLAVFLMIERRIHHVDGYARAHAGAQTVEREKSAGAEATPGAEAGTPPGAGGAAGDAGGHRRAGGAAVHMTFFLILTGIISAAVSSTIPFIPLYLVDIRGVDDRLAAGFISVVFGAGLFAAPLGGWLSDVFGRVPVMIGVGILLSPLLALIPLTPFPVVMFVLLLAIGTLMFTRMPTAEAHIAAEVAERHRSTVLGIYFFSGMEGSALLTPLLGSAIDRWGFGAAFSGLGAALAAVVVACGTGLALSRRRGNRAAV